MHWIALLPQPEPARALDPDAHAAPHRPQAADALQGGRPSHPLTVLGWWALQFTPRVALWQGAVLLEVSASLRLWGGERALRHRLHTENCPIALDGYGEGATSLVAWARAWKPTEPALAPDALPLACLPAAWPHLPVLQRLGCTCWGHVRRLPRAGLARRFGAALLDALDQAYGQRPDAYPWLTLPSVFQADLELQAPVQNASALLFGARRLMAQLQAWLQLRQWGVLAVELGWTLDARRNTAGRGALVLRSAQASADVAHLLRLLAERLDQVTLAAPALWLHLRSLHTLPLPGQSASLLPQDAPAGESLSQLLERLSVRLGPDQVLRLQPRSDHRPERMQLWRHASPASADIRAEDDIYSIAVSPLYKRSEGKKVSEIAECAVTACAGWASPLYPTWLLDPPQPLRVVQGWPHDLHGPLSLLAGPQRLESGWWPGHALALRDYFVARSRQRQLLWIYRERMQDPAQAGGGWYVHGFFA